MKPILITLFILSFHAGFAQYPAASNPAASKFTMTHHENTYIFKRENSSICDESYISTQSNNDCQHLSFKPHFICDPNAITEVHTNFSTEEIAYKELMAIAKAKIELNLCTCTFDLELYDDLLLSFVHVFKNDKNWQACISKPDFQVIDRDLNGIVRRYATYDTTLVRNIIIKNSLLEPYNKFFHSIGYKMVDFSIQSSPQQLMHRKLLKGIMKNRELIIPLLSTIEIYVTKID